MSLTSSHARHTMIYPAFIRVKTILGMASELSFGALTPSFQPEHHPNLLVVEDENGLEYA